MRNMIENYEWVVLLVIWSITWLALWKIKARKKSFLSEMHLKVLFAGTIIVYIFSCTVNSGDTLFLLSAILSFIYLLNNNKPKINSDKIEKSIKSALTIFKRCLMQIFLVASISGCYASIINSVSSSRNVETLTVICISCLPSLYGIEAQMYFAGITFKSLQYSIVFLLFIGVIVMGDWNAFILLKEVPSKIIASKNFFSHKCFARNKEFFFKKILFWLFDPLSLSIVIVKTVVEESKINLLSIIFQNNGIADLFLVRGCLNT